MFSLRLVALFILLLGWTQPALLFAEDNDFKLLGVTPGSKVIARPQKYDYVPTIISHGHSSTIWWCGALNPGAGDIIFAARMSGTDFESSRGVTDMHPVFSNSGNRSKFDGKHVCDPSIINVSNRMYLYYGGIAETKSSGNDLEVATKLGVAVSDDGGQSWKRANQGEPILTPRPLQRSDKNRYGLGQPSVVYHNGLFYLFYTNTVGPDGIGIYLVRSKHPLMTEAEEWTSHGFVPLRGQSPLRGERLIQGFSADWAFIPKYKMFMMALRKKEGVMQLVFFDETLQKKLGAVDLPLEWTEGPGLVRDESGNLVLLEEKDNIFAFQLLRSTGVPRQPVTWDISASKIRLSVKGGKNAPFQINQGRSLQ